MNTKKRLKVFCIGWLCNLVTFMLTTFLTHYTISTGHWSANAWNTLFLSSAIAKLFLSVIILIMYAELKD